MKLDDMIRGWFVGVFSPDGVSDGCLRSRCQILQGRETAKNAIITKCATEITLIQSDAFA